MRRRFSPEIKKIHDRIEKLEESIGGTDECVVDIFGLEEKLEDRLDRLEEEFQNKVDGLEDELTSVKAENLELNNYLNSVIKELNAITALLNDKYGDILKLSSIFASLVFNACVY